MACGCVRQSATLVEPYVLEVALALICAAQTPQACLLLHGANKDDIQAHAPAIMRRVKPWQDRCESVTGIPAHVISAMYFYRAVLQIPGSASTCLAWYMILNFCLRCCMQAITSTTRWATGCVVKCLTTQCTTPLTKPNVNMKDDHLLATHSHLHPPLQPTPPIHTPMHPHIAHTLQCAMKRNRLVPIPPLYLPSIHPTTASWGCTYPYHIQRPPPQPLAYNTLSPSHTPGVHVEQYTMHAPG